MSDTTTKTPEGRTANVGSQQPDLGLRALRLAVKPQAGLHIATQGCGV